MPLSIKTLSRRCRHQPHFPVGKKSNMPIKAAYRVEFVVAKLFFINNMMFNVDNDPVKRISARGLLIPEILIMIKQIINTLYEIPNLIYWNMV